MSNDATQLTPSENPEFNGQIPAYTPQTVVHPDSFNPVHQSLLDNDEFLRQVGEAQAQRVDDLQGRVSAVEQTSAVDISRAVGLDWLYRGNRIAIEFFTETTTLVAHPGVEVVNGIAGDDSIDLSSTAGFVVGGDYLLIGADGGTAELMRVAAVLNEQRLRFTRNMSANYGPGARLAASTLTPRTAGGVSGAEGAKWVSGPVNLGETPTQRAVVIRRSINAGEVRLYYRDAYQQEWAERYWSSRRSAGGAGAEIPAGFADYEYIIPMRGDGYLRAEVDGEPVDILHIVAIGGPTGLGGYINPAMRPAAPGVSNPAEGAVNVTERPTLTASGYSSPAGNAFASAKFQISTSSTFTSTLHDSGDVAAMTYAMPAGVLAANTTYYVRASVKDVAGLVSDWSAVSSFTTKTTFAYVNTPAVTTPTNGQTEIPEQPTLQTGAFAATGSADTHAASQWQIRAAAGAWAAPLHDSGESAAAKTSYTVPAGILLAGQTQYVMRVRHKGTSLGWSEWSSDVAFTTKQQFAQILGIVLTATGGGAGAWQRVDENFNSVTTTAATFSNHPTYAGVIAQTIDGQAMVKVPKFYVKAGNVPSGTHVGKRYWMVSDQPAAGFALHPAFMNAGAPIDQFWVGKYQGTSDGGTKLGSVAGAMPLVSIDFPAMQARAAARNAGGVTGFGLWDYYKLEAARLLALIEIGGADSQALVGQGNVSGSSALAVDNATVAQAAWRGIVGLWGNVFQMVDGLRTNASNQYEIWDNQGNKTWVNTGITAPANGYPVTFASGSGSGFDLNTLLLPATSNTTAGNGTTGDYFYSAANCVAYHGGFWGYGANAGLFYLDVTISASNASSYIGGRLAKV